MRSHKIKNTHLLFVQMDLGHKFYLHGILTHKMGNMASVKSTPIFDGYKTFLPTIISMETTLGVSS